MVRRVNCEVLEYRLHPGFMSPSPRASTGQDNTEEQTRTHMKKKKKCLLVFQCVRKVNTGKIQARWDHIWKWENIASTNNLKTFEDALFETGKTSRHRTGKKMLIEVRRKKMGILRVESGSPNDIGHTVRMSAEVFPEPDRFEKNAERSIFSRLFRTDWLT